MSTVSFFSRIRSIAVVPILAVMGGGVGYLAHLREPPEFESSTTWLISGSASEQNEADVPHLEAIQSPVTCELAIANGNLAGMECLRSSADPPAAFQARLRVTRIEGDTEIVQVRFRANKKSEPAVALSGLLSAYRDLLGDDVVDRAQQAIKEIHRAKTELLVELTQREKSYQTWSAAAPANWRGAADALARRQELAGLELSAKRIAGQIAAARQAADIADQTEVKDNPASAAGAVRAVPKLPAVEPVAVPPAPSSELESLYSERRDLLKSFGINHPRVKDVQARIEAAQINAGVETPATRLLAEERRLLTEYGPAHPKVREVREKLAALEQGPTSLVSPPDAPSPSINSTTSRFAPPPDDLQFSADLGRLESMSAELESRLKKLRVEVAALKEWEENDAFARNEIARLQRLFDATVKRLEEFERAGAGPQSRIIVLSEPSEPRYVARDAQMPLGIGMGIGAGVGLVLIALQRSARRSLAENPSTLFKLAELPSSVAVRNGGRTLGESLIILREPGSPAAESIRHLRVVLDFAAKRNDVRHLGFLTPPTERDAFEIVSNVAASLALTGSRVLLVDATGAGLAQVRWNLKPRRLLSDAVHGTAEFIDATVTTGVTHLHFAEWSPSPADATTELSAGLQTLQEKYDYLCFATVPSDDRSKVAGLAAAVQSWILVVRGDIEAVKLHAELRDAVEQPFVLGTVSIEATSV